MTDEYQLSKKQYINYLRTEKSLSENTIVSYSFDLEKFFDFQKSTEPKLPLSKITEEHITGFLRHLSLIKTDSEKQFADKSLSRFISSLRSFFKYLEADDKVDINPMENIDSPKGSRLLPEVLSIDETERLLKMPDVKNKLGLRDKALLETMYASGLRVSETINLEISNVFFEEGFLRIFGKGSKERLVPVGNTALKFITKYINESRSLLKNNKSFNYLFLNFRGNKLSRMGVLDIVRKYCAEAKIDRGVHPHTLRHTFATHMLQGGADIRIIQEMLGHSDISTTQIYTHIDKDYLREIHSTFHPRP